MANISITVNVTFAWWVKPAVFLTFLLGKCLRVSDSALGAATDKLIAKGVKCRLS